MADTLVTVALESSGRRLGRAAGKEHSRQRFVVTFSTPRSRSQIRLLVTWVSGEIQPVKADPHPRGDSLCSRPSQLKVSCDGP